MFKARKEEFQGKAGKRDTHGKQEIELLERLEVVGGAWKSRRRGEQEYSWEETRTARERSCGKHF